MFVLSRRFTRLRSVSATKGTWRQLSTQFIHPTLRDFTSKLVERQPAFTVCPEHISILSEPSEFHDLLLSMIGRAEKRIFISSLYIGSDEKVLLSALDKALDTKPNLRLYFQLDLNRSTRPGASSTTSLLLPLLRRYSDRVRVSLFRSPHLRGILAKIVPPRYNEGWGTWHAKIYGVDDEIMISGANLSKSYFTNRQDRYIHFSNQPKFSNYCFEFLQTASTFSFDLNPTSESPLPPHSSRQEDYELLWPDSSTHPHHIQKKVNQAFSAFQDAYLTKTLNERRLHNESPTSEDFKILLLPVIQAGQFNIREEETSLRLLFDSLQSITSSFTAASLRPLMDITSGYFGLYQTYRDHILRSSNIDCRIVAAGPKANGFYGSSGISGRIPEGYTLLEQRFMRAVARARRSWVVNEKGQGTGVQLLEWEKPGWTYHAKGIWLSPDHTSRPILTLFGSTNLNSRSAHIDTELSFFMIVPSESLSLPQQLVQDGEHASGTGTGTGKDMQVLRKSLSKEVEHIRDHAVLWHGAARKVRFWTKVIVKVVQGML